MNEITSILLKLFSKYPLIFIMLWFVFIVFLVVVFYYHKIKLFNDIWTLSKDKTLQLFTKRIKKEFVEAGSFNTHGMKIFRFTKHDNWKDMHGYIVIDTDVLDSEKLDYLEQKLSHTIKFREGGWCVILLANKKNSFCDEFLKDFANWYSKRTRASQFFSLPMVFDFEYSNFFICFPNYYVHINLIKEVFSNVLVEYNGEIDEIVSKGVELKGKRH